MKKTILETLEVIAHVVSTGSVIAGIVVAVIAFNANPFDQTLLVWGIGISVFGLITGLLLHIIVGRSFYSLFGAVLQGLSDF